MTTMAARLEAGLLERRFRFAEHGTTLARDTFAGMTTFVVMSYIIFVNPAILSFAGITGLENQGLAFDAVLASTCLVAGVMTILMGLVANKAYAIAPGHGPERGRRLRPRRRGRALLAGGHGHRRARRSARDRPRPDRDARVAS